MSKKNFTLIELIAAITIMLMVTMIISTLVVTFYQAYENSSLLAEKLKTQTNISRVADKLIRNAVPFVWTNEETGSEELIFTGEANELLICAITRSYQNDDGGLLFARIYLSNNNLLCDYSSFPLLPWDDSTWKNATTEILTSNVASLNFTYYTIEDDELETLETWDTEEYLTSIPVAIQLQLEFTDGTKQRWLRRTAGNSFDTSLGLREDSNE